MKIDFNGLVEWFAEAILRQPSLEHKIVPKKEVPNKVLLDVPKEGECRCKWLEKNVGYINDCPVHGLVISQSLDAGEISERHWDKKKGWVIDRGVNNF